MSRAFSFTDNWKAVSPVQAARTHVQAVELPAQTFTVRRGAFLCHVESSRQAVTAINGPSILPQRHVEILPSWRVHVAFSTT